MAIAFLLLVVVGRACGTLELKDTKETSMLTDRVDKLERLLSEQGNRLSDQEQKLYQQDMELTELRNIVREQASALSSQENLLRKQDSKLSRQNNLLRQQDVKLSHQERLLFRQGKLMKQLRSGLNDITKVPNLKPSDKKETVTSSSKLSVRSDDAGPLEAVVSHLSQQVTEMSADITAFKAQTDTEIQALKTKTSADIQVLNNTNTQQDNDIQDAQSSTFVHWGSSQCNSSSELVYSGVVGGSSYSHTGAATNYLCLTLSPVLADHQGYGAFLSGGEYEQPSSQANNDPVCAVCRSTFSTTVMIPGTNVCTPGWHLQYSGFLMAGSYAHNAGSEYICVDSRFQAVMRSSADEDGKLLFFTGTYCGSLPCPPYVNDKIVLCAVCSK